jgi:hypothetical protein
VEKGQVIEIVGVKVSPYFAVEDEQYVLIELSGDAAGIIVSRHENVFGLDHVQPQEKAITRLEDLGEASESDYLDEVAVAYIPRDGVSGVHGDCRLRALSDRVGDAVELGSKIGGSPRTRIENQRKLSR